MTTGRNAYIFPLMFILFSGLCLSFSEVEAQVFDDERITEWHLAGNTGLEAPESTVSIMDFGADNTGNNSCNTAFNAALSSIGGQSATIFFPAGQYFFDGAISIPNDVFIRGESALTTLRFDLNGSGNLFVLNGSIGTQTYELASNAEKGSYEIVLEDASDFSAGDVIRIYQFDEDLMYSTWAYGTLGQVMEILEVTENTVTVSTPLNHHFPLSREPYVRKLNPRKRAGIECLRIEREDDTESQTSNIYIGNALNCVIRNVESERCNFAHVEVNGSSHVQIEGCYFNDAFAYGGGGQGYGVVFQAGSSFCRAENNIFNHLRHSMLLQSGANGNVFSYNYSTDPFWEEGFLPADAAGDAVLHGNYTYLNLFEGNTVQNIVVDASHGKNGPFNTFFRNRAEKYGFFSDSGTPTDSMNVVGNEITSNGFPYGLFMLNGNGHYSYGNNVYGNTQPSGTDGLQLTSFLFDQTFPDFLSNLSEPIIGLPLEMNQQMLPAESRYDQNIPVECQVVITSNAPKPTKAFHSIQMAENRVMIPSEMLPATVNVYATDGRLMQTITTDIESVELTGFPASTIVLIQVIGPSGTTGSIRAFVQ